LHTEELTAKMVCLNATNLKKNFDDVWLNLITPTDHQLHHFTTTIMYHFHFSATKAVYRMEESAHKVAHWKARAKNASVKTIHLQMQTMTFFQCCGPWPTSGTAQGQKDGRKLGMAQLARSPTMVFFQEKDQSHSSWVAENEFLCPKIQLHLSPHQNPMTSSQEP
jgi:hypothetical protein